MLRTAAVLSWHRQAEQAHLAELAHDAWLGAELGKRVRVSNMVWVRVRDMVRVRAGVRARVWVGVASGCLGQSDPLGSPRRRSA